MQRLEEEMGDTRDKYEEKLIQIDRMAVEHQKKILELAKNSENSQIKLHE